MSTNPMPHFMSRPMGADTQEDMQARTGILPADAIAAMVADGQIDADVAISAAQIQPASLDLRLGTTAYRLRASFLPGIGRVRDKLAQMSYHQLDLTNGAVLEKGGVYLVPLLEQLALDSKAGSDIAGIANPKSSTGRIDVFTRLITETGTGFDAVPQGYCGQLYLEVSPRSFSVLVRTGSRLAQLRLRRGQLAHSDTELHALHQQTPLVDGDANINNGLALSVDLRGTHHNKERAPVGYRARRHTTLIDVDKTDALAVEDFWEPIYRQKGDYLILDPDEFYILASREAVRIPPTHAAEMVPFDPMVGEFRVHYAGFFDPGFGCDAHTQAGARAVLEVRSRDVPFILEHGQLIGRLIYEKLTAPAPVLYGAALGSNYQSQGLRLSKHFKQ